MLLAAIVVVFFTNRIACYRTVIVPSRTEQQSLEL